MIIDIFPHLISERAADFMGQRVGYYGDKQSYWPRNNADPEIRLRHMDDYGVDMQALNQSTPFLMGLNAEDAAELCRISNDDNYKLCKTYPDRFVNVCMISLFDMDGAMKELDRSINELDCRGVTLSSNQNGKGLDSPEFFPFYEKVVENDLPILIHPVNWESYPLVDMFEGWRMMHIFGWPFDSTQAVWRLIFGGVFDRFPTMKIVMHHLGGMLPFYARRVEVNFEKFLSDKLPKHISEYWPHLYGDTAVDGTVAAYPCGYAFFGPDRMVFATDYPFGLGDGHGFIRDNLEGVKAMDIPDEDMNKILGENAKRLLKID
ncbi:MAG: amidohydrolase [Deltaproteobacteria bacterium]|nr:amidohydrolase [Deltaproteobacteria bacterium]